MNSIDKKQQGFSLVMAVFILVVLALLAAAMMNIFSAGADSVAREVLSSRALMAADSGVQRKLHEIFPPGGVSNTGACVSGSGTTYNDFGGLQGCSNALVVVTCDFVPVVIVDTINYFTINSQGRCGPTAAPAVRVVEVQARDGF